MTELRYVERDAYRPAGYVVDAAELTFELDYARTVIHSRLHLRRNPEVLDADRHAPLTLQGRDFELLSLSLNDVVLTPGQYAWQDGCLRIPDAGDVCVLAATTAVRPGDNRSQMGLFKAGACIVSQCEADGFQRMTFCMDRPDVMSTFRVRLEADLEGCPVLLSNGDCVASGALPGGRHFAEWHDPHPKPTYIFAVVAGDLAVLRDLHRTGSGSEVQLAIYAAPHQIEDCGFAMQALKQALDWDEREYGLEYDLSHYSIVAMDEYTGAMENKGLNLFEAKGILASPRYSTDNDYVVLQRILAHEVLHNWTGNRVTCRDWFELCLKEGLTRFRDRQFSASMGSGGARRIDAVAALRRNQFPEDDSGGAHAVKPGRYVDVQNLYTQTVYEKGAELIRMLQTLLGEAVFRTGVKAFLAQYDGRAVTTDQLLETLQTVSGRDLTQFRQWYVVAGRPRVTVQGEYLASARRYQLTLAQQTWAAGRPVDAPPLHIPVTWAAFDSAGDRLQVVTENGSRDGLLELTQARQTFVFEADSTPVFSLFRGFSAPVSVEFARSDLDLAVLMAHEDDPIALWDAAQQLARQVILRIADGQSLAEAGAERYVDALENLFGAAEVDPAVLAWAAQLPDEPFLSDGLDSIDLDGHMRGRSQLHGCIADRLGSMLMQRCEGLDDASDYLPEVGQIARRALRNVCLELLTLGGHPDAPGMCLEQIHKQTSMNNSAAALELLCHRPCPERDTAIATCRENWQAHPIAFGQWLKAIALARAPDAVDRVLEVAGDDSINLGDPANSMAFFGSFFRQNRVAFHDPSGRGYDLLADVLLRMDQRGVSGSKWLMPQIAQWHRHEAQRRKLMQGVLERIAATEGISSSLAENVNKALQSGHQS